MHEPSRSEPARGKSRSRLLWGMATTFVLLAALAAFAVLNPALIVNALAPRAGIDVRMALAYGDGPRRSLDVYAPQGARNAPVVVFFYGGSWQRGNKEAYRFVAADLARRGFIAVVPDYSVYPAAKFPDFLEDGAKAVAWTRANVGSFGGNPHALLLMGHSAGAHIAAMLAFDARWLARHDMRSRKDIAGVIGLAGPYDFLPIKDPIIREIFAVADQAQTQPITFVQGGEPPVWLGVAASDTTVRPGNSERLAARLRSAGGDVTLRSYARPNHITLIGAFSPLLRILGPVADDVAQFATRATQKRTASLLRP